MVGMCYPYGMTLVLQAVYPARLTASASYSGRMLPGKTANSQEITTLCMSLVPCLYTCTPALTDRSLIESRCREIEICVLHCGSLILDSRYEWLCFLLGIVNARPKIVIRNSSLTGLGARRPVAHGILSVLISRSWASRVSAVVLLVTSFAAIAIRPTQARTARGRILATNT